MLADDHPPTLVGVGRALQRGGFHICAETRSADEVVEAVVRNRPDVVLVDVDLPGGGIAAARRITQEARGTAVVMLTGSRRDEDLFAALRAGAVGYLLKDTDPERLPFAVRGVLEGEAALPRTLVTRLIHEYQGGEQRRRTVHLSEQGIELSAREWEVLELLAEGLSTKDIAARLGLSDVTVRRHISRLLTRLGVASRQDAVELYSAAG